MVTLCLLNFVFFFFWDKTPDINHFKGGVTYFGSWFQRAWSIVGCKGLDTIWDHYWRDGWTFKEYKVLGSWEELCLCRGLWDSGLTFLVLCTPATKGTLVALLQTQQQYGNWLWVQPLKLRPHTSFLCETTGSASRYREGADTHSVFYEMANQLPYCKCYIVKKYKGLPPLRLFVWFL